MLFLQTVFMILYDYDIIDILAFKFESIFMILKIYQDSNFRFFYFRYLILNQFFADPYSKPMSKPIPESEDKPDPRADTKRQ